MLILAAAVINLFKTTKDFLLSLATTHAFLVNRASQARRTQQIFAVFRYVQVLSKYTMKERIIKH